MIWRAQTEWYPIIGTFYCEVKIIYRWSNGLSTLSMVSSFMEVSVKYVSSHDHKLTFNNLAEPS